MTYPSVPWLVSALSCLLAAALALLLPETSGTTLPDVVDEAEVVGLARGGDVFKSSYARYGRSPYWTELDNEGVEGTLQRQCERGSQLRSLGEKSEQSLDFDAEVNNSGVSRKSHTPPHSLNSHSSSDSLASLMSLVDVSRVNGNNSDTSDSNEQDSLGASRERRSSAEQDTQINITENHSDFKEALPGSHETVRHSSLPTEKDDATDFVSTSDNNPLPGQRDENEISLEAVENDFSMSVFSLKFRHIKRPISPTDRRMRVDLHSSSSSSCGYTSKAGKTLVQEYISHHSSSGDATDSGSNSLSEKDAIQGTPFLAVPFHASLSDSPEAFQHVKQLKEVQESTNYDAGDDHEQTQTKQLCKHKNNEINIEMESMKQPRGGLSASPSPEPKPKMSHPSPATQVRTCGSLSDKPHSGEEETCNSSPLARYYLTTFLHASSSSRTDHRSTYIVHPTQGFQATRETDGDQSEGGQPAFKATAGKCKAGLVNRDEKPAGLTGVERILSTRTDGKSKTGEAEATSSDNTDKKRQTSR